MVTGKLSDLAGLFILPLAITVVAPRFKHQICLLIGLLFVIWKSPVSSPFIHFFNTFPLFNINRVIDYTDLLALGILPFSHLIITSERYKNLKTSGYVRIAKASVFIIACFAFSATSMIRFEIPKGTIYLGKSYSIKLPRDTILSRINQLGYQWTHVEETTSNSEFHIPVPYYQINDVIITDGNIILDTLKNIKFTLQEVNQYKSKLELINIELTEPGNIQNWKYLRQMHKFYKNQIKRTFIKELKD